MQISGNGRAHELASLLFGVQEAERPVKSQTTSPEGRQDQVEISSYAKEILRLQDASAGADETRAARVEQIRQAVDTGTYDVSGRSVADRLIRHVLTDAVL